MKTRAAGLIILAILITASCSRETIFINGPVLTMDASTVSGTGLAVVIRSNLISEIVSEDSLDERRLSRAVTVDLDGRLLMPGIIESHGHMYGAGLSRLGLDLRDLDDKDQILETISREVADHKPGEWIIGSGWDHTEWGLAEFPTANDLDAVSPDNPVLLTRIGGHSAWVNSAAMEAAGIDSDTPNPDGGIIVKDEAGNPTGILLDNAIGLFDEDYMGAVGNNPVRLLKEAQDEAFSYGITTFHDMGFPAKYLPIYTLFYRLGILKINLRVYVADDEDLDAYIAKNRPRSIKEDRIRIAGIKTFADGAMGSFGALLSEPYSDNPHEVGIQVTDDARLKELADLARDNGYQLAVHAIGDLANKKTIEVYRNAIGIDGVGEYRWRIEHAQFLRPEDISVIASNGYIPSMQPRHATTDMKWVDSRLGEERGKTTYAWRSLLDAGAIIPGGSDVPVEPLNPFWGMYAAVTRQDHQGFPPEGFNPEQRVSRAEALKMYTLWGAWAGFDENSIGKIREGYQADFVILDRDVSLVSESELKDAVVEETWLRGKRVYSIAKE